MLINYIVTTITESSSRDCYLWSVDRSWQIIAAVCCKGFKTHVDASGPSNCYKRSYKDMIRNFVKHYDILKIWDNRKFLFKGGMLFIVSLRTHLSGMLTSWMSSWIPCICRTFDHWLWYLHFSWSTKSAKMSAA